MRQAKSDTTLVHPVGAKPYPTKADQVSVHPVSDGGGNFGRLPRSRPLMDDFIGKTMEVRSRDHHGGMGRLPEPPQGRAAADEVVVAELQKRLTKRNKDIAPEQAEQILSRLDELRALLREGRLR
ncbi:hypothetical protein GS446_25055, partial [Rhodococcus hoagii]|nr:hypothetical protein [Prescottella equi]